MKGGCRGFDDGYGFCFGGGGDVVDGGDVMIDFFLDIRAFGAGDIF
ncbi:MAG: hypothetical protein U1E11_10530 [Dethiobacteria bacterium]|nr:hypothetical protein [Dethiobacteria bacterium]